MAACLPFLGGGTTQREIIPAYERPLFTPVSSGNLAVVAQIPKLESGLSRRGQLGEASSSAPPDSFVSLLLQ